MTMGKTMPIEEARYRLAQALVCISTDLQAAGIEATDGTIADVILQRCDRVTMRVLIQTFDGKCGNGCDSCSAALFDAVRNARLFVTTHAAASPSQLVH
jgi:hypothetical protein